MPEPVAWGEIDSFRVGGTRTSEYLDLDLQAYVDDPAIVLSDITIEKLRTRRVSIKYARSGEFEARWSLYQCLITEQRIAGRLYVLIEGQWFSISDNLAQEVDAFAASVPSSATALLSSGHGEKEPEYNKRLVKEDTDSRLLMDAQIKRPGGASSGIEVCDVLTADGEFIHVKRKSRSSTLSHLFAQGTVSATTYLTDGTFRDAIRTHIQKTKTGAEREKWLDLVPDSSSTVDRAGLTVSYVVIANSTKSGADWIPFFSKLNLMQSGRQIQSLGLGLTISRVPEETV